MSKQLRVTISPGLHTWLDTMSQATGIREYSELVSYLLQRTKDQTVFSLLPIHGANNNDET